MASLYSKVERRMWGDRKFRALSAPRPNAQTIWVYLLTGPQNTVCPGLLEISAEAIAGKHRWPVDETRACLEEILEAGMAIEDRDAGIIVLPNALAANAPQSLNVVKAWPPVLAELPESDLVDAWIAEARIYLAERGESWIEAFEEAMADAFGEAIPEAQAKACAIQEPKQEQEEEGGARASAAPAPVSAAKPRKAGRGRSRSAEPPPDDAPEGVCRTWMRLWLAENGTGYLPSPFCFTDGVRLGTALEPDQVELLEPAMRAFQKDPKTRRQGLNEFCRVAAGLIAEAAKKRRKVQEGPTIPLPPDDPVRPLSAALPWYLLETAANFCPTRAPVIEAEKEPNACPG